MVLLQEAAKRGKKGAILECINTKQGCRDYRGSLVLLESGQKDDYLPLKKEPGIRGRCPDELALRLLALAGIPSTRFSQAFSM